MSRFLFLIFWYNLSYEKLEQYRRQTRKEIQSKLQITSNVIIRTRIFITMFKKLFLIFITGFLLNFIWENLHSYLYFHPNGEMMTQGMLLKATLFDSIFITLLAILFIKAAYFRDRKWYVLPIGIIVAILIELSALKTGRWAYNEFMPIIPLINIGLTPTIQLGILSYLIFKWQIK